MSTFVDVTRTYTDGEVETHRYVWPGWEPEAAYRHQLERKRHRKGFESTDPATRAITVREYVAQCDGNDVETFRVDWVSVSRFIDATEPVQHDLFGGAS